MTKSLLIFFVLSAGQMFCQKADTLKFDKIFGCSCCADTLRDFKNKNKIYVLTEGKTQLTAYKSGKRKWSTSVNQLHSFGDNYIRITCMEFYKIGNRILLQLSTDHEKYNKFHIDPKNGTQQAIVIHEKVKK